MSNTFRNRKSDNPRGVNTAAKGLLAKLLSTADLRVVHSASVSTATWSGATRTLTLPIWKEMSGDIYDMLVCHEVGHVLWTPSERSREVAAAVKRITGGKKHLTESAFGFLNVCEDNRIERKMKTRYPGSRRSFVRGYQWLRKTGTWKTGDTNTLKFIDRVNVASKLGAMFPVKFSAEEQILMDRLDRANSFNDVVDVTEAMYRLAQDQKKNETKPPQPEQGDGEGDAPAPGENREPQDGPANTDIPDDPKEDGPKETGSSDDDTDDGEGADSTDGDGTSDGEGSDGKSDRAKPEDKDESSDENADGKSSDSDGDDADADGDADGSKSSDSDGDDTDGDADGSDSSDADGDDADGDADGSESGDADGDDGSESGNANGDSTDKDGDDKSAANGPEGGDEVDDSSAPDAPETTTGIEDAIKTLVDRNATERVYVNVPKVNLSNIIEDHKDLHNSFATGVGYGYDAAIKKAAKALTIFEKESKPVVNTMAKRFDMKKAGEAHRRAMTAKTGRIDPSRLAFYKVTDDIFLRQTLLPDGKNHGLVMFIDWSGSMENIMSKTIQQMLNLVMFCRRVGMPFEVYGFSNMDNRTGPAQVYKSGDFEIGSLVLHNWMSGRMSAREFKRAMLHMMMLCRHWAPRKRRGRYGYSRRSASLNIPRRFELGGTPLDDAIAVAMQLVPAFQAGNNVQIVNTIFLTDGASGTSPIFSGHVSRSDDIVVHDPTTRKDYRLGDFDDNGYYSSDQSTALLLTMLAERTDSNVIGFYLMSDYYGGSVGQSDLAGQMPGASSEEVAREWKRFTEDKFAVSSSKGYSEYYLIPADLEAKTAVLATGSAESFTAMSRSKLVNRVLLNRFIDIIAKK